MQKPVSAIRVLVKAILLFVVFNLVFAWLDPAVGKITGYNSLWPGRLRFPYEEAPRYYAEGHNAPVIDDFDAMFGSHVIEAAPKPADEFRVLLLGDSATWGGHVSPPDMLAEQFNRMELTSCDGRKIKAYDMGYPWPSLLRDVLVLDRAKRYEPDMVVWLVTLHSFEKKEADREFIGPHMARMSELVEEYDLKLPKAYANVPEPTLWDRTIVGQRKHLKDVLLAQAFGPLWAATGVDNHYAMGVNHPPVPQDVLSDFTYFEYKSGADAPALVKSLMFDTVRVGHEIADPAPVIMVNEPIFIASGQHSNIRYNHLYPRWAYNAYRAAVRDWMKAQGYVFYDFWKAIPTSEFVNDTFHRDPLGEKRFAELLAPLLVKNSCP